MRLDLYLKETALLAEKHGRLLDQAAERLHSGDALSELEQYGVLHALQVLTENAIGKTKHLLNSEKKPVPVSAYDAFRLAAETGLLPENQLNEWYAVVGLRNRIVHDYLNIDFEIIETLLKERKHQRIVDFLKA